VIKTVLIHTKLTPTFAKMSCYCMTTSLCVWILHKSVCVI